MFRVLAIAVGLSASASALAQGPLGKVPIAGPRTKVMTLGSVHLSGFESWNPAMLEPLLVKLAAFSPGVITIEGISGEQCAALKATADSTGSAYSEYCWNPDEIIGATKRTVQQANLEIRETLKGWTASPSAAQRRRLAMLFLAAGDRASAKVQWLRLPQAERRAGDGIDKAMIELIERRGKRMNESYDVAAVLAARLGLERVYPVDDHSSDAIFADVPSDFDQAFADRGKEPALVRTKALNDQQTARVRDGETMLDLYRATNARDGVKAQVLADFGGALAMPAASYPGRTYVGWWEVRNLRMVANARSAFAARPGARVLNIVGSSHKPWYDALFATMADIDVVDATAVLR